MEKPENAAILPARFERYLKHKGKIDKNRNIFITRDGFLNPCQQCDSDGFLQTSVKSYNKCDNTDMLHKGDVIEKTIDQTQDNCTVKEIFQAVEWIKDQIVQMKEEDKMLMQQFLDLRARIRNIRSHLNSIAPSNLSRQYSTDISASHLGIDEACEKTFPIDLNLSPNQEEDYLGEFRDRTVSMLNVHNPQNVVQVTSKTIRKYRTEEYL